MVSVSWEPYNARNPFGKSTVVAGDNIPFSRDRWEATKAVRLGRGTPEQIALVNETDLIMQEAVSQRKV